MLQMINSCSKHLWEGVVGLYFSAWAVHSPLEYYPNHTLPATLKALPLLDLVVACVSNHSAFFLEPAISLELVLLVNLQELVRVAWE